MEKVQLLPAFVFTCDDCGTDTFVRGISPENPEEHAEAQKFFRELIELQEGPEAASLWDGELLLQPTEVTCSRCQKTYLSEYDMMLDSWDDDEFFEDDDLEEDDDEDWNDDHYIDDWDEDSEEDDEDFDEGDYDL